MIRNFDLIDFENHIIFKDGEQLILVDTGSPMTCAHEDMVTFMGEEYGANSGAFGGIVEALNYPIDVLMGLDVLSNYYVKFDYEGGKIVFSTEELTLEGGKEVEIERGRMGLLFAPIAVEDRVYSFVIDSGAKISYVTPEVSEGMKSLGEEDDFYPGMPKFKVPIYETKMGVGGVTIDAVVGNLPEELRMELGSLGDSIIGSDLFTKFQVVIDFNTPKMMIKPYAR